MKVLITGFDPFGGESINPALEAVKMLPDAIAGAEIVKLQIPVVTGRSIQKVHEKMQEIQPDIVISIGQAGGRFGVTPERVAINITDARIPDNDGNQPIDEPIFADGDTAYFSNLPVKAMVQAIKDAGYPASLSNTAGTYICNHVMYTALETAQKGMKDANGKELSELVKEAQAKVEEEKEKVRLSRTDWAEKDKAHTDLIRQQANL